MPPKPFGFTQHRQERERERQRERTLTVAEHQVLYRAEAKRQNARYELEQQFKRQLARIAKTLKGHTDRVNAARWGRTDEGDGYYVITKAGTTECSARVRREYTEQS